MVPPNSSEVTETLQRHLLTTNPLQTHQQTSQQPGKVVPSLNLKKLSINNPNSTANPKTPSDSYLNQ